MHCRIRYFDPIDRRAGLPDDVASLVEKLTADQTVLTLVNNDQSQPRTAIVQGGAYGEHEFREVECAGKSVAIHDNCFRVVLSPGAGARLTMTMRRYANQPTLRPPYDRAASRPWHRLVGTAIASMVNSSDMARHRARSIPNCKMLFASWLVQP